MDKSTNNHGLFIIFFVLIVTFALMSSGIVNGNLVISIDTYATTLNGASVGGGISRGGGANGLGNSGFCGTNPSDPSCFNSQTSDCTINPSDPSCQQQPSCPTIAIGMPCTTPNRTSASSSNSTSSSSSSSSSSSTTTTTTTSSAKGGS